MSITEIIVQHLTDMPPRLQAEVLDFVEFLESKTVEELDAPDDSEWTQLSLQGAMRGLENEEEPYTEDDLKEPRGP